MAESDKTVSYAIDGNADGLVAAMTKAREAGEASAKGIASAYSQLGSTFKALQGVFTGALAIFAGGAAFKAAVDATKEWGAETGKLSKQLQITAAEATAYQVAAAHLGLEAGQLVDASDKMARQLQKNESAFKLLGIETRNANGSWRSTGELLPVVMDKLRGIDNVTQQNIAGQQLFGKSWAEVRGLMKLSAAEMDNARQKARDLNLEVDPKQVKAYKESMNDIKLIMTSLSIQVGNALLPVLTELGKWFGEVGPTVIGAFSVALKTVSSVVTAVWNTLKAAMTLVVGLVDAAISVIEGKYSEAWDKVKNAGGAAAEVFTQGYDKVMDIWKPKTPNTTIEKGDGGKYLDFEKAKHQNLLAEWEAQLEERKLKLAEQANAEGVFAQMSKDQELAFWREKLAIAKSGSTEQTAVRKKLAELGLAVLKEQYEAELATLQAQQQAYKNNLDARKALIEDEARLVAQKYGEGSKEYQAVQGKLTAIAREESAQRLQIAQISADRERAIGLAALDARQAELQLDANLQLISRAQLLAGEQQFENERFAIRDQALQAKLALAEKDMDSNPVEYARIKGEIEALEIQHQQRLAQIRSEAVMESNSYTLQAANSMQSGFARVFAQIGTSITTIGGLIRNMAQVVLQTFVQLLAQMAAKWLVNQLLMKAISKATKVGEITAEAGKAGAAGTASMAGAPWPLNMGAPAFGLAMSGLAMSFLPMASASMGYDIPGGVNPVTQLHEREMVLPAKHADVIRNMADGGGAGGGGNVNVSIAAHPMPGNYFMVHRDQLVQAIKAAKRGFEL